MNWKRIWTGAALAGFVIFIIQLIWIRIQAASGFSFPGMYLALLAGDSLLQGFFCSTLYAVARPRLGPGPKTALIVGTSIFLIKYGVSFVGTFSGGLQNIPALLIAPITWFKFVAATYLAGWQYIEKAP